MWLFRRTWKIAVSVVFTLAAVALVLSRADFSAVADASSQLSGLQIGAAGAALLAGALLASLRVWMIARDLGYPLAMRDAVAVLSIGQLAGGLFFQLVGQLIARGALLARRGLPVSVTIVLTGYERIVALAVSLVLALAGSWLIFGRIALDMDHGGLEFAKLMTGLLLAIAAGAAFGWGRKAAASLTPRLSGTVALRACRSVMVSIAIQLCTMAAYVIAAKALQPDIPMADLSAAAAVVMLAASLPISLAGWGVREVSAVLALGAIGMPPEKALVVALLVGIGALVVVALLALLSAGAWRTEHSVAIRKDIRSAPRFDYTRTLVWALPLATATAVFFQTYVPVGGGRLNVNFADPIVILGGALFVLWAIRDRAWPKWRLSGFNAHVFIASAAFVMALAIGWASFGWTSWAVTNKFAGWFVLLAYGATGALLVSRTGSEGFTTLMRTVAAAAAAIALCDIALIFMRSSGVDVSAKLLLYQAQGFALNRNAFAFQMLLAASAALVMVRKEGAAVGLLAVALAGLWFTGSRAAFGTCVVIVGMVLMLRPCLWRRAALASLACACVVLIGLALPYVIAWGADIADAWSANHTDDWNTRLMAAATAPYGMFATDPAQSDAERFTTLHEAWQLFVAHPVFGAGLGAFVEQHLRATGEFLVIHSTPLWLLAEFGLIGTAAIVAPLARTVWLEAGPSGKRDDAGVMLLVIIATFGVMSLVHEMMYQRLFWLMLGAGLALIPASSSAAKGSAQQ